MSPELLAALKANAAAPTGNGWYGAPAPAPPKQRGRGGFLSSLISEVGGSGGAIGGAAAGAAAGSVVPGIGTLIGGIVGGAIGGFGGGTAGRAIENKVRDNEYRLGDALKEGAISGVLGGAGSAFNAARGLKAAGGFRGLEAATAAGGDDALTAASKSILTGGKKAGANIASGGFENLNALQAGGRNISSNAMGIGQGAKATGIDNLGAQQSDELLANLTKELGIKRGNPEKVQRALEPIMNSKGAELADMYAKSGAKISQQQYQKVANSIIDRVVTDPSINLTKAGESELMRQVQLLGKAKTPSQLWEYQKALGNSINFGKNASAKLVDREAVARVIREETGTLLDDVVKEAVPSRAIYSKAKTADALMRTASKQADKSGMVARVMTSAPLRNLEAKAGGALETTGNALSTAGPGLRLARGAATRGLADAMLLPQDNMPQEPQPQTDVLQAPAQDMGGMMGADQVMPQAEPYSLQQALGDAYQIAPNASESELLSYAKALQAERKGTAGTGQGGPDITKVTAQQYSLAQRGAQALTQMQELLQRDPGVLARTAAPGRKLPIVGGFISNAAKTGDFDAIGYNIASSLLRIETGAQANESEIKNLQAQMIPRAGDSPETVARKMQQLNQAFAVILDTANGGGQAQYQPTDYGQLQGAF